MPAPYLEFIKKSINLYKKFDKDIEVEEAEKEADVIPPVTNISRQTNVPQNQPASSIPEPQSTFTYLSNKLANLTNAVTTNVIEPVTTHISTQLTAVAKSASHTINSLTGTNAKLEAICKSVIDEAIAAGDSEERWAEFPIFIGLKAEEAQSLKYATGQSHLCLVLLGILSDCKETLMSENDKFKEAILKKQATLRKEIEDYERIKTFQIDDPQQLGEGADGLQDKIKLSKKQLAFLETERMSVIADAKYAGALDFLHTVANIELQFKFTSSYTSEGTENKAVPYGLQKEFMQHLILDRYKAYGIDYKKLKDQACLSHYDSVHKLHKTQDIKVQPDASPEKDIPNVPVKDDAYQNHLANSLNFFEYQQPTITEAGVTDDLENVDTNIQTTDTKVEPIEPQGEKQTTSLTSLAQIVGFMKQPSVQPKGDAYPALNNTDKRNKKPGKR